MRGSEKLKGDFVRNGKVGMRQNKRVKLRIIRGQLVRLKKKIIEKYEVWKLIDKLYCKVRIQFWALEIRLNWFKWRKKCQKTLIFSSKNSEGVLFSPFFEPLRSKIPSWSKNFNFPSGVYQYIYYICLGLIFSN